MRLGYDTSYVIFLPLTHPSSLVPSITSITSPFCSGISLDIDVAAGVTVEPICIFSNILAVVDTWLTRPPVCIRAGSRTVAHGTPWTPLSLSQCTIYILRKLHSSLILLCSSSSSRKTPCAIPFKPSSQTQSAATCSDALISEP